MEVMEEIMDTFSFEVPRRGCKVDTWSCRNMFSEVEPVLSDRNIFVLTDWEFV